MKTLFISWWLIWWSLGFLGFTLIVLMSIASKKTSWKIKSIPDACGVLSLLLISLLVGPITLAYAFSESFIKSLEDK